MASRSMSQSVTQENALDWVKQDKRRMLHVVYRVGDLDKSIKYVVSKIELVANLFVL
jgi:lactoylglutathione lyase